MADTDMADGAADGAALPAPKRKIRLIVAVIAVLVVLGGGAATWFFFFRNSGGEMMKAEAPPQKPPAFVEVPEILVNLAGAPGERVQYLKVKAVLEVKEEKQAELIRPSIARVSDLFQTYLRELRVSDLNGSMGLFRLREELTKRVNVAVAPNQINAVLFKEIVIQ